MLWALGINSRTAVPPRTQSHEPYQGTEHPNMEQENKKARQPIDSYKNSRTGK